MAQEVVLVTGASSGLGKAIAERFVRDGARVVGTSRTAPAEGAIAGVGLTMIQLDVCDDASVEAMRQRFASAELCPETIILNAGFGISGAIEETPVEAALSQFDTNLMGAHRVVRALLPALRARGGGHIIFVGSVAGRIALPFQGFYSASKAALASYAEALRIELRPFAIKVTLVEPGDHCTGFTDKRQRQDDFNSPYDPQKSMVLAAMIASEEAGATPESLAETVAKIAATARPRPRYIKLSLFERMFVTLRSVLPAAHFEAVLRKAYRLS